MRAWIRSLILDHLPEDGTARADRWYHDLAMRDARGHIAYALHAGAVLRRAATGEPVPAWQVNDAHQQGVRARVNARHELARARMWRTTVQCPACQSRGDACDTCTTCGSTGRAPFTEIPPHY